MTLLHINQSLYKLEGGHPAPAGLTAWPGQRGGELAGARASDRARSLIVEC